MKIDIAKELTKLGYTWENEDKFKKAFPNPKATMDLLLYPEEYEVLSVKDFIDLINTFKLDIRKVITNDYKRKSDINKCITKIDCDSNKNIIKQYWKWNNVKKDDILDWALLLLEQISRYYKISLINLIKSIKDIKKLT